MTVVAIAAVTITGCVGSTTEAAAPSGAECLALVERQAPDLEARAKEILKKDGRFLQASADCDSGAYPAVLTGLNQEPSEIVRRMERLGNIEEIKNTSCLEHLAPSDCDQIWRFTPSGTKTPYLVEMARDISGEFVISLDLS